MTHDPDQRTGPTPIAERSTYSEPTVQAAIHATAGYAKLAESMNPAVDLGSDFVRQIAARIRTAAGGIGAGSHVHIDVAASAAAGFARDAVAALDERAPVDRVGEHYRAEGASAGTGTAYFPDFCGYCQNPGDPDRVWPCGDVVTAVAGPELKLARDRAAQAEAVSAAATARVTVLTEAGRLTSEGAATEREGRETVLGQLVEARRELTAARDERDVLSDKVGELEEVLAHRVAMHSGYINPTPGQITAYVKAVRKVLERDGLMVWSDPAAIRAGLADVQFALINPDTAGTAVTDPGKVRPGDIVTYTAAVVSVAGGCAFFEDGHDIPLDAVGVTVMRPVPPLPTEPGTVIEATVHGRTVTLVLTDDPDPEYQWFVIVGATGAGAGRWVSSRDITAHRVLSTPDNVAGDTP